MLLQNAEAILYRYKLQQAIAMRIKSIYRTAFKEWLVFYRETAKVRLFAKRRLIRMALCGVAACAARRFAARVELVASCDKFRAC